MPNRISPPQPDRSAKVKDSTSARIVAVYLAVGILWVFFSDQLLYFLLHRQTDGFSHLQTLKGWFDVVSMAIVLYWLISREVKVSQQANIQLKRMMTELLVTQKALQESQRQFAAFMDNSPSAAWITDSQGQMIYVSQSYFRMFQVSSDLVGQSIFDLYPQEVAQAYLDNIQAVAKTGQVLEAVEPGLRYDGSPGQFRVYKFPLLQPDGTMQVGGVAIDVTEQRRAKAALSRSEQRFRALVENAADIVVILDAGGNFTYASPSAQAVLGYSEANVLGRNALDFVHPEDAKTIIQTIGAALAQPNVSLPMVEYRTLHSNGTWRHLEAITRNLLQEDAVEGIVINCWDVTERKAIEALLTENRNKYQTLFETLPIGILVTDAKGNVVEINPTAEGLLGVSNHDLHHSNPKLPAWSIIRPDFTPLPDDEHPGHQAAKENRLISDVELILIPPSGGMQWVSATAAPIPLEHYGAAIALVDLSERKQAEDELYQREQEFKALADNAPDIITRFDYRLRHLYINPAITKATGLLPQHFIGKTNEELGMPEEQLALWNATFSRVFVTGEQQQLEFQFPTPEGLRDYEARCVPEFAPDGTVASALVVARDVTDQKQLERLLRQELAEAA